MSAMDQSPEPDVSNGSRIAIEHAARDESPSAPRERQIDRVQAELSALPSHRGRGARPEIAPRPYHDRSSEDFRVESDPFSRKDLRSGHIHESESAVVAKSGSGQSVHSTGPVQSLEAHGTQSRAENLFEDHLQSMAPSTHQPAMAPTGDRGPALRPATSRGFAQIEESMTPASDRERLAPLTPINTNDNFPELSHEKSVTSLPNATDHDPAGRGSQLQPMDRSAKASIAPLAIGQSDVQPATSPSVPLPASPPPPVATSPQAPGTAFSPTVTPKLFSASNATASLPSAPPIRPDPGDRYSPLSARAIAASSVMGSGSGEIKADEAMSRRNEVPSASIGSPDDGSRPRESRITTQGSPVIRQASPERPPIEMSPATGIRSISELPDPREVPQISAKQDTGITIRIGSIRVEAASAPLARPRFNRPQPRFTLDDYRREIGRR